MALLIVYRLYPLLTSEWGSIEAQFYVCCTVWLLYLPYTPTQNKYCYSGILAIICLPEFSCHLQLETKRTTVPTWDPPDWPLCQYSSSPVHTAYFDCVIRIQTQISVAVYGYITCLDALPSTQPSSSIDLQFNAPIWLIWYHFIALSLFILTRDYFINMCMHSFSI